MVFGANVEGRRVLYRMSLDSGAQATAVVKEGIYSGGFETADRRFIIYTGINPKTGLDVMAVPLSGSGAPVPLAATPASEVAASMSDDGRWLVIADADVNAGSAVVRRLDTTGTTPVLGGTFSLGSDIVQGTLRRDAAEMFLTAADGSLKSMTLTPAGDGLTLGPPKTLFQLSAGDGSFGASKGGNEFVVTEFPFARGQTLRVLTNWEKRLDK
jgi:hypothetical protein